MKTLDELIDNNDSAWPIILEAQKTATNKVVFLPPDPILRNEALVALQMTTWSTLGAVVYETGGILIDDGWLRVLGSGHPQFSRSVAAWTTAMTENSIERWPYFLVADDALGGFFAVDCGALGDVGKVFYFAPDTFQWENMEINYDGFLRGFCMNQNMDKYYAPYRWDGWQADMGAVSADEGFSITPPLVVKPVERSARQKGIWEVRSRHSVPIAELFRFNMDVAHQLDEVPNGGVVVWKIQE